MDKRDRGINQGIIRYLVKGTKENKKELVRLIDVSAGTRTENLNISQKVYRLSELAR